MAQHHSIIIDFALTAAIHLSQHSHANYRATIINQPPFTTRAKINVAKIPFHQQWHALLSTLFLSKNIATKDDKMILKIQKVAKRILPFENAKR